MKYPILYSFVLLLLVCSLFSCSHDVSSSDTLRQVEILLDKHPDSALTLLNKVNSHSLKRSDDALYCLLMTKALIKNSLPITSDSLINIALEYYKDSGDSLAEGDSYYYAGRISLEMQDSKRAMELLLKAADLTENSNDYKLQYLIYYYLGELYIGENLYDFALKKLNKAYYFSRLLNDSSYTAFVRRDIAISFSGKNSNDSALNYYYQALNILPQKDTATLIILFDEMGGIYNTTGNYAKSIQLVNRAISLKPAYKELFYGYLIKARVYLNTQQYDSANYYYNKTIHSPYIYTRASSYEGLARVYSVKGNYKGAFQLMRTFNKCRDSIDLQTKSAAIIEMQNIYQHEKSKEQIQRLILEKKEQTINFYHWGLLSFIFLLLLCGTFFIYRNLAKKKLLEKSKILLEQENRLIKMREKECKLREDFFKKLNNIKKIPSLGVTNENEKIESLDITAKISLTSSDWEELIRNIDIAYDHFTDRLTKAYPNLNIQEIHLCCLVKIKVARNDLANIFCITPQSVKTTKYRIKKDKMGITDKNISLDLFLEKF